MKIQFDELHQKTKNVFRTKFFKEYGITYDNIDLALLKSVNTVIPRNLTQDRKWAFFEMLLTTTELESDLVKRFDKFTKTGMHTMEAYRLKFGDTEGQRRYAEVGKSRGQGNTLEGQIKKYGKEEGTRKHKEMNSKRAHTLENFVRLYGEKEGQKRYQSAMDNKGGCKLENLIRLYGEEEGKIRYHNWVKACVSTEENFIKRHGKELGMKKWTEFKNKSKSTKENFIRRHGKEEGLKRYKQYCERSANTKENFIRVHGEKEGLERWEKYKNSNAGYIASEESLLVFEPLTKFALSNDVDFDDIFYGADDSFEYKIEDNEKLHSYDYTIIPLKLIFEYNGRHIHPSKTLLSEEEWNAWRSPWTKETADEARNKDLRKIKAAEKEGFTVIEIWDFEDKNQVVERCKRMIKERI